MDEEAETFVREPGGIAWRWIRMETHKLGRVKACIKTAEQFFIKGATLPIPRFLYLLNTQKGNTMKNHAMKINMNLFGLLAAALILGFGCPLYAGKGDNQDDPKSGKIDQTGDGNSGQGDDLHKKQGKFDKNSDRKPGQRMRKHLLKKFDSNGDGKLDDAERAKAKEAFQAKRKEMIKRFDADGDGELSKDEMEAAKEQWKSKKDGKFCKPGSERRKKGSEEDSRQHPKSSREYPSD